MIAEINSLEAIELQVLIQKVLNNNTVKNNKDNSEKITIDDDEIEQNNNEKSNTDTVQPSRVPNNQYTKLISKGIKPYRQKAKRLQREGQNGVSN